MAVAPGAILRKPAQATGQRYDLIIIGGGIYGAMLSLEAARRGLRSLLLERRDFGSGTSHNSLRIIHGGLRYLQTLDLPRFAASVRERRWFLKSFPGLVQPLPCFLPLYGTGIRRPGIFRLALSANELLGRLVTGDTGLPPGRVIDSNQAKAIFPRVDTRELAGAGLWYDAWMPESQRVIIETLRWAAALGATLLNYVEAMRVIKNANRVRGVSVIDRISGASYEFHGDAIINAAGPWCRQVAQRLDRDEGSLFRSSLAFNVLFNKEAVSDYAVGVTPAGANTYFILPLGGRLFAGTGHVSWVAEPDQPMPSERHLAQFIADLNAGIPGLGLRLEDVARVYAGLLPALEEGTAKLATREVIHDHGARPEGLSGLFSVSGVKFTTSRRVAEKTLDRVFPRTSGAPGHTHPDRTGMELRAKAARALGSEFPLETRSSNNSQALREIIEGESVQYLDDLLLRRTALGDRAPPEALRIASSLARLFDWDEDRRESELTRLQAMFYSRPGDPERVEAAESMTTP